MVKLTILHGNDLHGQVSQRTRIARLVRKIRSEVEAADGYCLYANAGDSEASTHLESSLTTGNAIIRYIIPSIQITGAIFEKPYIHR